MQFPLIVSFQKSVFYIEFINVSDYLSIEFSALMRDTKTTNTDRDLLVIELYDEDFDKNNTIILTE
tara:strand:- start:2104 stop:2301 length:198 start_codon:yes stop_codon:yes gene_type:complete